MRAHIYQYNKLATICRNLIYGCKFVLYLHILAIATMICQTK